MDHAELDKLRQEYPTWGFSLRWFAASSGSDKCLFVATREGVRLSAWTVSDLRGQVAQAEREMGR